MQELLSGCRKRIKIKRASRNQGIATVLQQANEIMRA
jgi:hypothetical protein